MGPRVLIVEDEEPLMLILRYNLATPLGTTHNPLICQSELNLCQIEVGTSVCHSVGEAWRELAACRARVQGLDQGVLGEGLARIHEVLLPDGSHLEQDLGRVLGRDDAGAQVVLVDLDGLAVEPVGGEHADGDQ